MRARVLLCGLLVLAACGGEDEPTSRGLSVPGQVGGLGSLGGLGTLGGRGTPAGARGPHIGKTEDRGHTPEARTAGAPDATGEGGADHACGYICRGLARCGLTSPGDSCSVCSEASAVVLPACRAQFSEIERCLGQVCTPDAVSLDRLLLMCGTDELTLKNCVSLE